MDAQQLRGPERTVEAIADDRDNLNPGESVLLIVEDDPHYARILMDLAHDNGFKVLVAQRGADALALATEFNPNAVSLDVFLPDMLGWSVLSQLKQNPLTRHIPVQMITLDEDRQHGLAHGAFSFMTKPTTVDGLRRGADAHQGVRRAAAQAAAGGRGQSGRAARHPRAAAPRRHRHLDGVGGRRGARVPARTTRATAWSSTSGCRTCRASTCWKRCSKDETLADIPVVVFTGRELSAEEDARLHTMARSVVVKGVESPERLLDETALFLHRVVGDLPQEKQQMLERLHELGRGSRSAAPCCSSTTTRAISSR